MSPSQSACGQRNLFLLSTWRFLPRVIVQAGYLHARCYMCNVHSYLHPFQTPTGEWDVRLNFEFGLSTQHYANVQKHGIVDALHAKRWAGANHPAETLQSPMPAVHAMKLT